MRQSMIRRAIRAVRLLGAPLVTIAVMAPARAAPPPANAVVILVDDLGVGDCGFSGATDIPTPNLDRFAREGTVCTQAYVMPSCSPTRAALLTGRYPSRFGIEDNRPLDGPTAAVDVGERFLPELLRDRGYRTALCGKWHLGKGSSGPQARGFDEFCGWIGAAGKYIDPPLIHGTERTMHAGWVDDLVAEKAAAFIHDHAADPFFLHVAFMAAHLKQEAEAADMQRFAHLHGRRRLAAAIISRLDAAVGRVLDALRTAGVDDRTLVFFLSDNGGEPDVLGTSNGPHRGQKFDVLEGGIHVPFAMRWPGVVPAGKRYDAIVHCMDICATIATIADVSPPLALDGVDLLPFIRGDRGGSPHERLFWVFNLHADWRRSDQDTNLAKRLGAVREGDWKLVLEGGDPPRLYRVTDDPAESRDLAHEQPDRVAELTRRYREWDAGMVRQVIPPDHPIYGRNRGGGRASPGRSDDAIP